MRYRPSRKINRCSDTAPGVELATLASVARLVAVLRSGRQARLHWDDLDSDELRAPGVAPQPRLRLAEQARGRRNDCHVGDANVRIQGSRRGRHAVWPRVRSSGHACVSIWFQWCSAPGSWH
jgi:hypothetical protein